MTWVLLMKSALFAELRMWHSKDGTRFAGEYVAERLDRYYFRDQNGETRTIAVDDLVPNDEKYIRTLVPPDMDVRFRKKEFIPQGQYADPDTTVIDGTLTITKTSRKPFLGKLHGELYYVGEEVATDHYMILAKNKFSLAFPDSDEREPVNEIRLTAEARVYEEYNRMGLRGREYDGYAAVIFSTSGELVLFETDLHWLTEEKLEAFRELEEFNFFREDCKKTNVPRPQYYRSRGYKS